MINHARTLLLNQPGATSQRQDIGEEYIPPTFVPRELPTYLQTVRRVLFGSTPDRYFLNFRARELMQLLHQTELGEFVYALDSRVTYWPENNAPFFGSDTKISIAPNNGNSSAALFVSGSDVADLGGGKSLREYVIEVGSGIVTATLMSPALASTATLVITDGSSQPVQLPQSALSFRLVNPTAGDKWTLTTIARPAPVITTLLPVLELLGEPVLIELFGVNPLEPLKTFKNLWFDHANPVYRLGGLVLAMIYRANELGDRANG